MKINLLILIFITSCSLATFDDSRIDPKPDIVNGYSCDTSYKNLYNLCQLDSKKNSYCCEIIEPTKLGYTFDQFCQEFTSEGIDLNFPCLSKLTNCNQIDVCTGSD